MPVKERRRFLPPTTAQTTGEPSWRWRRIAIFGIIVFCMVMLIRLHNSADTALNYAIAIACAWLLGVLALIYTGFATAQDLMAMFVAWSGRPYAPQPGKVETTETKTTIVQPDAPANDPNNPPPGFAQ